MTSAVEHLAAHDERVALRRPEPVLGPRPHQLAVRGPLASIGRLVREPRPPAAPVELLERVDVRRPAPRSAGDGARRGPGDRRDRAHRAGGSTRRSAPAQPRARGQTAAMHQRFSVASPGGLDLPTDVVTYGPDVAREDTLRLLGNVDGKRILDLGCGAGHNAIALARQGAKVIGVDESSDQVAEARAACDREQVQAGAPPRPARRAGVHPCRHHRRRAVGLGPRARRRHRPRVPPGRPGAAAGAPARALASPPGAIALDRRRRPGAAGPALVLGPRRGRRRRAPHHQPRCSRRSGGPTSASTRCSSPQPTAGGPRTAAWHDHMRYVPATLIIRARKQGI